MAKSSATELPFYHGKLSREEAEHVLNSNFREGVHLVRVSTSSPGDYVLSLCASRQTLHFQIKHQGEVRACTRGCPRVACTCGAHFGEKRSSMGRCGAAVDLRGRRRWGGGKQTWPVG